ncbi:SDR family NAD(P)-dependent oxidoreductase [Paenibacillus gorillae]|uniref:SDR family NAD(P)-dependent oxidoreductase n=1 Tax=Paenibacillus gorillae TaxID=1243662 RepID=UPI0009DE71D8|nr:SDR family NAD(P)-dependent oxidoreductase [Paenibacillus gorillae]
MSNPFTLNDKWIIVTGASSGIGAETAKILSQNGARIILVGRNESRLQDTLNQMYNPSAHVIEVLDLNDSDAIPSWMKKVSASIGSPFHGLAHFAGIQQTIPLRILNEKKYR